MKKLSMVLAILALAVMMAGPVLAQGQAPGQPQTKCPVLGGNVDKTVYADYIREEPGKIHAENEVRGRHPGEDPCCARTGGQIRRGIFLRTCRGIESRRLTGAMGFLSLNKK
jgi:hypothetical protein